MQKILFISDLHLGVPDDSSSRNRELKIIQFFNEFESEISDIFIVGDLFDFWFEYREVVPKGFYRLLGKMSQLADKGIQFHIFTGNHDMWMRDFFKKEFNAKLYFQPEIFHFNSKKFYIGHGDGLGPGDYKYKFLKLFFSSSLCQFLFRWIHPDIGIGIANFFSKKSRQAQNHQIEQFQGKDNEWLYLYSKSYLEKEAIDYFIFGHRHLPIEISIENSKSKYINLGDWLSWDTYAIYDGNDVSLRQYGRSEKNPDFSYST